MARPHAPDPTRPRRSAYFAARHCRRNRRLPCHGFARLARRPAHPGAPPAGDRRRRRAARLPPGPDAHLALGLSPGQETGGDPLHHRLAQPVARAADPPALPGIRRLLARRARIRRAPRLPARGIRRRPGHDPGAPPADPPRAQRPRHPDPAPLRRSQLGGLRLEPVLPRAARHLREAPPRAHRDERPEELRRHGLRPT
jgi:hypothetical protein